MNTVNRVERLEAELLTNPKECPEPVYTVVAIGESAEPAEAQRCPNCGGRHPVRLVEELVIVEPVVVETCKGDTAGGV